ATDDELGFSFPTYIGRVQRPARSAAGVGVVNRFETTASSRYDSLQLQLRGRFAQGLQAQLSYVWSKALDDVSDVFDLAGASALPQNSLSFAGERGVASFDVTQRFTAEFIYDFSNWDLSSWRAARWRRLFDGLQIAGAGQYRSGQPFTVNSLFDVNLDG